MEARPTGRRGQHATAPWAASGPCRSGSARAERVRASTLLAPYRACPDSKEPGSFVFQSVNLVLRLKLRARFFRERASDARHDRKHFRGGRCRRITLALRVRVVWPGGASRDFCQRQTKALISPQQCDADAERSSSLNFISGTAHERSERPTTRAADFDRLPARDIRYPFDALTFELSRPVEGKAPLAGKANMLLRTWRPVGLAGAGRLERRVRRRLSAPSVGSRS